MPRTEYVDSIAAFLKDQGQNALPGVKKIAINAGYLPVSIPESGGRDTLYIDVSPGDRHGETTDLRRTHTRHERDVIRVLVRKRLPEKPGKEQIDPLVVAVECIGDLLLNSSWGDPRCASIDATPFDADALAAGLFSSTITVCIESKWDY